MDARIPIEVKLYSNETVLERLVKLYTAYVRLQAGPPAARTGFVPARKISGFVQIAAIRFGL
jgi:hypothetical protein